MSLLNRVMSTGKGAKIWFEGNMFCIRKKPNLLKGVKYAYWDCAYAGCRITCKTPNMDSVEGIEFGRTTNHNHENVTCGEIIRMEMVAKGKLRARKQTESIGKILDDLENEYLTRENIVSVQWSRDNMKQVLHRESKKAYLTTKSILTNFISKFL